MTLRKFWNLNPFPSLFRFDKKILSQEILSWKKGFPLEISENWKSLLPSQISSLIQKNEPIKSQIGEPKNSSLYWKKEKSLSQKNSLFYKEKLKKETYFWLHTLSNLNVSDIESLRSLEGFTQHLMSNPISSSYALTNHGIGVLLLLRQRKALNLSIKLQCQEALQLLGYHEPPLGSKGIRILSIDGGGMKGIVGLEVLREFEKLTGKKIHELFDFILGVSTGSIIASLLAFYRSSISDVEEIYSGLGRQIFSQSPLYGAKGYLMSHAYYDTASYEKALKGFLSESKLTDSFRSEDSFVKVAIVSTLVSQTRMVPFVFRNYIFPHRSTSHYPGSTDHYIWEAIRASSAAPGYFDEFILQNKAIHHDGGLIANNGSQIAIHEAGCLWPKSSIQCLVSLGHGRYDPLHFETSELKVKSLSLAAKFSRIVDSATDTELVHETLIDLLPRDNYYRFNPYLPEYISLDETRPEKIELLKEASRNYIRRNYNKVLKATTQLSSHSSLTEAKLSFAIHEKTHMIKAMYYYSLFK